MNYEQYKEAEKNKVKGIHYWANKCRKIQKSLKYNTNPNAVVRHHLRNTEEQRKYNDEHYEFLGFEIDENGEEQFEYGKYIIFVTKEEHLKIHKLSDETRAKHSASLKIRWLNHDYRCKMSQLSKNRWSNPDERKSMILAIKESNTDEVNKKRSLSLKGRIPWNTGKTTPIETKIKISEKLSGEGNPRYGKPGTRTGVLLSDETKQHISDSVKIAMAREEVQQKVESYMLKIKSLYKQYKELGGKTTWNSFTSFIKNNKHVFTDDVKDALNFIIISLDNTE